jgi:cytidine deaminase
MELTSDEKKLIAYAKKAITKYNKIRHAKGDIDTLYSFVLSETGKIYDGACFEPNLQQATICGERHAIANMALAESRKTKIKCILVADPVPSIQEKSSTPCGTCRHLIWQFGKPETSIICMQYIQGKKDWSFPKIEKFTIAELYPYPYEPIEGLWDNWKKP